MKYIFLVLFTIGLQGLFSAIHSNSYDAHYNTCKADLIKQDNYQTDDQVFKCAESKLDIIILGTLLFREGSILQWLE